MRKRFQYLQEQSWFRYGLAGVLIAIPIVLLALPATHFDHGQSLCLSRTLFDFECWGCGMTRAIMRMVHLDFAGAMAYNKLSLIVGPTLLLLWLKLLLAQFRIRTLRWL